MKISKVSLTMRWLQVICEHVGKSFGAIGRCFNGVKQAMIISLGIGSFMAYVCFLQQRQLKGDHSYGLGQG